MRIHVASDPHDDIAGNAVEHQPAVEADVNVVAGDGMAPGSHALRLVRRLVSEGVLFRAPDEHDRRRNFLVINPKFEQPLVDHLSEQVRAGSKKG